MRIPTQSRYKFNLKPYIPHAARYVGEVFCEALRLAPDRSSAISLHVAGVSAAEAVPYIDQGGGAPLGFPAAFDVVFDQLANRPTAAIGVMALDVELGRIGKTGPPIENLVCRCGVD